MPPRLIMSSRGAVPYACTLCSTGFTQKSSLKRHSRRCTSKTKVTPRQKSCRQCSTARTRCNLQRPTCSRCQSRSQQCEYVPRPTVSGPDVDTDWNAHDEPHDSSPKSRPTRSARSSPGLPSVGDSLTHRRATLPKHIPPEFIVSPERRQAILGTAPNAPRPSSNPVVRHTMHFVIRALLSWPRLMSIHPPRRLLPPPIHKLQIAHGVPSALANCYALTKMWAEHTEETSGLIRKTVLDEIERLLSEHSNTNPSDLLAESQSLLILLIILLFGLSPTASHPLPHEAPLLIRVWDLKHALSATGLSLPEEDPNTTSRITPAWGAWVDVTAKRRTVHAFHQVEWAWSVLHGYPVLTCFELGPLPAPPAGYLWREENREVWEAAYAEWAERWTKAKGGLFRMVDFFEIEPGKDLDRRGRCGLPRRMSTG